MERNIEKANTSKPRDGFIPNPKLRLLDQVSEVIRFKHYSIRTEEAYRNWIRRYILFHGVRRWMFDVQGHGPRLSTASLAHSVQGPLSSFKVL